METSRRDSVEGQGVQITATIQRSESQKITDELEILNLSFREIPKFELIKVMGKIYLEAANISITYLSLPLFQIFGMALMNYVGEINMQSAFGIAMTMRTLFCYSLTVPMNDKLGIELSRAIGNRDFPLAKRVLLQGLITSVLFLTLITCPIFLNSARILQWIGVQGEIAALSQSILAYLLFTCYLESITGVLQTSCFSQGVEDVFSTCTTVALILGSVIGYVLVVHYGFKISR